MNKFELYQGDAISWLASLPSESVDLVVTDPAYESLEKHRAKGTTTRLKQSKSSSNQWFPIFPNSRFPELFSEIYRVLREDTHFYMFCDQETMFLAKPLAEAAGFKFWKPLVWSKLRMGMGYHYRSSYEFILFFEKGKRRLRDLGVQDVLPVAEGENPDALSDVLPVKSLRGKAQGRELYPTEKPVELLEILIEQSAEEGEVVVDPFLGSGATGVAALSCGMDFLGCDIQEGAIALARERLRLVGDEFQAKDKR